MLDRSGIPGPRGGSGPTQRTGGAALAVRAARTADRVPTDPQPACGQGKSRRWPANLTLRLQQAAGRVRMAGLWVIRPRAPLLPEKG